VRKFDQYPIYINHPGRFEEVRLRQRDHFVDKGDWHMMSWLDYTGKRLYEIIEDKNPRPESVDYENAVFQQLRLISTTIIGRLLFDSLNRSQKYWIVPLDYLDKAQCACGAYVFPGKPNEGGGIRLYYTPTDFNPSTARWKGADDILFHEMVHAYRNGRVGYDVVNAAKPMNDYDNAEEFLALHLQNVYLACRGSHRFYRTYKRLESVSKNTAYQYFVNDMEVLMAFRYFAETEPLAATVSRWMHPPDSFNPWRDQRVLERLFISNASLGLPRLPPF
jgi:hypothetical protein